MCGIAGLVRQDGGPIDEPVLDRMTRALAHRGPDAHGLHVEPGVGLGHRRLSVIDIAGGAQPMHGETGFLVLLNCEIYNFVALRERRAAAGHRLTIGARQPEEARSRWQGPAAEFAIPAEAIAAAEVVFNATPGDTSVERLGALAEPLAGKLLVDVANATSRDGAGRPNGLLYPSDSLAERLQAVLPATCVVKTLNTMLAPVMSNPHLLTAMPTAFLSGNDAQAKVMVRSLLADMGWEDGAVLDLGGIETARGPEAVMLMVPDIMRASGFKPFAVAIAR